MLGMITIRNLIRSAGTALSYRLIYINSLVVEWLISCVQEANQENTRTALLSGDYERKNLSLTDYKTGIIKTAGFNLVRGKRSIHSRQVHCSKGYRQIRLFNNIVDFTKSDFLLNLDKKSGIAKLIELVRNSKNKDGRYGKLIQIIGSIETLSLAYLSVKSNKGISSKGFENETLDRSDEDYLNRVSRHVIDGSYKFSPVRVIEIPKPGKPELRLLGNNPRQKIVQKAIDIVFNIIFEEVFLDCSHGFRPEKSCHSALKQLQLNIGNPSAYTWVIEKDIQNFSTSIPHIEIIKGLRRKIDCPATIRLVKRLLSSGYIIVRGKKHSNVIKSNMGIPQGIVNSPLFSNVVLHELDKFVINELAEKYTVGKQRKRNGAYRRIQYALKTNISDIKDKRKLIKLRSSISSKDPMDTNFKRIFYVRYADHWVILVCGSFQDAKDICESIFYKLNSLGVELNREKTKIRNIRKSRSRFLGVDFFIRKITTEHKKPTRLIRKGDKLIKQRFSPRIIFHAPIKDLLDKLVTYGFIKRNHLGDLIPKGKSNCVSLTHPQILKYYNNKIKGILNYYSCCHNRMNLWSIVRFLHYSCALTLAKKFKLQTLAKTFRKFGRDLTYVNEKGRKFSLYKPNDLRILDINKRFNTRSNLDIDSILKKPWSNSMIQSQFDESCVLCGTNNNIEIHHTRSIKNVRVKALTYAQWEGVFNRKSISLCSNHHLAYYNKTLTKDDTQKIVEYKSKKIFPKNDNNT
uniref:Orf742 n=1 Tax=Pseudo-nitzschia multiseries TaxID=37319 RepID=A0A0G3F674_PSEMU|nr:orf742 [Pseudo-nitzschia multiseries]AKJ77359.1 orf742 [Pseudo-nitzschia multiseries]